MMRYWFLVLLLVIPATVLSETQLSEKILKAEENLDDAKDDKPGISLYLIARILKTVFSSILVWWIVSFIILPPITYCVLWCCGFTISGVRAYSYGAVRQSEIGHVERDCAFSDMQSMGACGSMKIYIWIGLLFGIPSGIAFGFVAWPYFA